MNTIKLIKCQPFNLLHTIPQNSEIVIHIKKNQISTKRNSQEETKIYKTSHPISRVTILQKIIYLKIQEMITLGMILKIKLSKFIALFLRYFAFEQVL